ncbi:biopolymer transporter ExbD [Haloferula sp. BvORR071]|uniref:ExbD/TolR family protein n=1 Tax=Haloferula sp. BvORR071 TaxID=1396141 RepID=UPI0031B64A45
MMASADDKSYDDINVTPMVDLYLVLLLIFIIMTTAGVQGTKVNLPKADKNSVHELGLPGMQAVTVSNQGKIFLNTIPVTPAELESKLGALKAKKKDLLVVVRGDSRSQYQGIMDVLDALGRAGIDNIGMATTNK